MSCLPIYKSLSIPLKLIDCKISVICTIDFGDIIIRNIELNK